MAHFAYNDDIKRKLQRSCDLVASHDTAARECEHDRVFSPIASKLVSEFFAGVVPIVEHIPADITSPSAFALTLVVLALPIRKSLYFLGSIELQTIGLFLLWFFLSADACIFDLSFKAGCLPQTAPILLAMYSQFFLHIWRVAYNEPMKRVLVVGGSEEYTGAVYLAGVSALRSGAESVIVMTPEKVAWALNALSPDLVTRKLKGKYLSLAHKVYILKQLKTADVLVLGNGAGTLSGTAALMRALCKWSGPKVIDADALKALRGNAVRNAILTPNEGEWTLLERGNDIKKLLTRNIVIIKKGAPTKILSGKKVYSQKRTNAGLQKAGTGDVLAGMCAGFLAQGLSLWDAAKKAATTGNTIADVLEKKKRGYYFLASDIVEELRKRGSKRI